MKIPVLKLISTLTVLALLGCQGPAVKRGQTRVPEEALPLACLTVALQYGAWPLQAIEFENLANHSKHSFTFGQSFGGTTADYPTAIQGSSRVLCMAIVHLQPGEYIIRRIEFSPTIRGSIATTEIRLDTDHQYTFVVIEGAANYLGSIVLSPDWPRLTSLLSTSNRSFSSGTFGIAISTEQTQSRDMKWAADVVPGMAPLKSVVRRIEVK